MNTASTELECFQELQKQEHLAASYRVLNLTEEVNKQKALEQTLQCRYGDLLSGFRRIQGQLEEHNRQLKIQEEIEAENRAPAEEVVARDCAAEEEERKSRSLEEEGQTNIATDGEAAGSKGTTEDQMDVDNRNRDEEFVGPIPPAPDTEGDNDEVTIEENTSNAQSTDPASTDDGADKTDPAKPEGQDKADDAMAVDAGPQEEGKDEPATVGASVNEGNTAVSFEQAVSNEDNGMAPE